MFFLIVLLFWVFALLVIVMVAKNVKAGGLSFRAKVRWVLLWLLLMATSLWLVVTVGNGLHWLFYGSSGPIGHSSVRAVRHYTITSPSEDGESTDVVQEIDQCLKSDIASSQGYELVKSIDFRTARIGEVVEIRQYHVTADSWVKMDGVEGCSFNFNSPFPIEVKSKDGRRFLFSERRVRVLDGGSTSIGRTPMVYLRSFKGPDGNGTVWSGRSMDVVVTFTKRSSEYIIRNYE